MQNSGNRSPKAKYHRKMLQLNMISSSTDATATKTFTDGKYDRKAEWY